MDKKGKLFIISGPSGVGKGTLANKIVDHQELNISLSISATTRDKRTNELEGQHYFFVTKKEFLNMIKNKELLEYNNHFENYYGTPKDFIDKELKSGKNILLEIDVNGALKVMESTKDVVSIFISPPSLEELKNRIQKRGTETEEKILKRISRYELETSEIKKYNYSIVNDSLKKAEEELMNIISKEIVG